MKKIVLVLFLLLMAGPFVQGQGCSVCTQAAAGMGDKSAKGLNGGIIYLAFLPLIIMGTVGFLWWKNSSSTKS